MKAGTLNPELAFFTATLVSFLVQPLRIVDIGDFMIPDSTTIEVCGLLEMGDECAGSSNISSVGCSSQSLVSAIKR